MEKKLLPSLWDFFIIIKEFPGPAFFLNIEHAHLPVLGEKVHLTTYSLCMTVACQNLKRQDKAKKDQLQISVFFSHVIAQFYFGAIFLIQALVNKD